MKERTYHLALRATFVDLSVADGCEVQSLTVDKSYRLASRFTSEEWGLLETLVCLQYPSLLSVAWNCHVFNAFVRMCESIEINGDTRPTFCFRGRHACACVFGCTCGQLVVDRRTSFNVW